MNDVEVRKRTTATVYLNGEVIMRDVLMIEPVPEGVRWVALSEPVQVAPAAIRQIDLIKHPILSAFMASHGSPEILSDGETHIPSYPFPEAAARAGARCAQSSPR